MSSVAGARGAGRASTYRRRVAQSSSGSGPVVVGRPLVVVVVSVIVGRGGRGRGGGGCGCGRGNGIGNDRRRVRPRIPMGGQGPAGAQRAERALLLAADETAQTMPYWLRASASSSSAASSATVSAVPPPPAATAGIERDREGRPIPPRLPSERWPGESRWLSDAYIEELSAQRRQQQAAYEDARQAYNAARAIGFSSSSSSSSSASSFSSSPAPSAPAP